MERRVQGLVDGYELVSHLGRGSHGEVFRAIQSSTGQPVAVKVLRIRTHAHSPPRATQVERFRREMTACARLQHPNIVRAIDAGVTQDGRLYSVFEYVPGPTLRNVLQEHRALPIHRLREFLLQTLDALVCAHASGIIHRDFKPENIVVSTTGIRPNFKVLDFGVSAFLEGHGPLELTRLTGNDEVVGTPAYAAPEQLLGETPTTRTDLYAWGLVGLECLTGCPAVQGISVAEVHYLQLLPDEICLPVELAQHPLGELLRWVLFKQPERRAADASAVYSKLEAVRFEGLGNAAGYLSSQSFPSPARRPPPAEDTLLDSGGERRLLTALCLRFSVPVSGSTNGETGARSSVLDGLLQDQRRRCQQALQNAGGQLVSFVGSRALGIFGFPESHEQDARRAVQCAMDVHQSVVLQSHALSARLGFKLQVSGGLHTGLVALGGAEVSADQVAGLVLAEASDLADRAQPGEILVTAASELPARRDLEFEAAGDAVLATSGIRCSVYRLIGARDPFTLVSSTGSLLGREQELSRLEQQLQHAARGVVRSVWLEGEAGIGKSALLQHFSAALPLTAGHCLQARCLPEARHIALHPILELLRSGLGLKELEPDAATARLKEQLSQHGLDPDSMAPLVCPWLQLPMNDSRPPPFAPQRMRELSIDALARFVASLFGNMTAIFVLEDAHWCDATTREWLEALRAHLQGRPTLILVTTRPGFDPRLKTTCSPDEEISLSGLGEGDAAALVARLAGEEAIEPLLAAEMVRRADGVPLFLQELTRYVKSHRIVSGGALEIPHGLRGLLGARLDQLGPAKDTAQVAAVIGREFNLSLLQRVSSRDSATLLGDVEQLVSAGLVEMQRRIAEAGYRFRHMLVQATAYDALLPASREHLHRRVAETLEADFADVVRTEPQLMGRHWASAGAVEQALVYAKRASMDLLARSSHLELIEHSQMALSWVKGIPDVGLQVQHELDLMLPYLLASMSVHGYAEGSVSNVIARAEHLLTTAPEYEGAFGILFAVGMFYHAQGLNRPRALAASERLAQLAGTRPECRGLNVFAWAGLANCHYADGQFVLAQSCIDQVCGAYTRDFHGPMAWQFGFDAWVAAVAPGVIMDWVSGDWDRSQQRLQVLDEHAKALGHPESVAQVLFFACVQAHCRGDREQMAGASGGLAQVADEHRLGVYMSAARLFAAWLQGDAGAAVTATAQLHSARHLVGASYQWSMLAEIELANGGLVAAADCLERGIKHAESSGERFWLPRLLCQRAILSRRMGQPISVSLSDLDVAITEASQRGMLAFELEANVAYSTLWAEEPTLCWDAAGVALSRSEVLAALESIRRGNTTRQVSQRELTSVGYVEPGDA